MYGDLNIEILSITAVYIGSLNATFFSSRKGMPQYKLIYFNTAGRAELIRLLFAYADQEYEDFRFEHSQWPQFKLR